MASWFLVPCLVHMRDEWNAISPKRDKGSDGSIGDTAHSSRTSDHNPRSNGAVLALDIDSTGPWPGGFDHYVQRVVARCRSGAEWRLEYVIWDHKIASRSDGWKWVTYTGSSDPHTGHAHFSARHDNTGQSDTRSWHIADEGEDWFAMATKADLKAALKELILSDADVRAQLQALPWQYKGGGLHGAGTSLEALGDTQDLVAALGTLAATVADVQAAIENPTGNPTHPVTP